MVDIGSNMWQMHVYFINSVLFNLDKRILLIKRIHYGFVNQVVLKRYQ